MILLIAIIVNILFIFSAIEVHFKSPLIQGLSAQCEDYLEPLADRLVLFVTDGLRADFIYNVTSHPTYNNGTYFLREIIEKYGSWGVAHCRLPTMSRPGCLAFSAGIYEDPSAIFTDFTEGLTEFDHIFNRSSQTFYIGFPGFSSYFRLSPSTKYWYTDTFKYTEFLNRGTNSSVLDVWVFEHIEQLLNKGRQNKTLGDLMKKKKVIYCFHLAGIDLAFHNGGLSQKCIENLIKIDEGIKRVVNQFNEFFNDNKTVYLITSDHGMSDDGIHYLGSPNETQIPILAWGAGIAKSSQNLKPPIQKSPISWNIDKYARKDIRQIDVASLISALLGLSTPVNNIGQLPVSYLNFSEEETSKAMKCNALQLYHQSEVMDSMITPGLFVYFGNKSPFIKSKALSYKHQIDKFIEQKKFNKSIKLSKLLMEYSQDGLEFYQKYYVNIIKWITFISFAGWTFLLSECALDSWILTKIEKEATIINEETTFIGFNIRNSYETILKGTKFFYKNYFITHIIYDVSFIILGFISLGIVYFHKWPCQYIIYIIFSLIIWWRTIRNISFKMDLYKKTLDTRKVLSYILTTMLGFILTVIAINRNIVMQNIILAIMVLFILTLNFFIIPKFYQGLWIASTMIIINTVCYPALWLNEDIYVITLSICFWIGGIVIYIYYNKKNYEENQLFFIILGITLLGLWNVSHVTHFFRKEVPPKNYNYNISWIILIITSILPLFSKKTFLNRYLCICFCFAIPFFMMSTYHEALGLFALTVHLLSWAIMELYSAHAKVSLSSFPEDDITSKSEGINHFISAYSRQSFLLNFYIWVSFYAVGNSCARLPFTLNWIKCFIRELNVPLISVLIFYRQTIPLIITLCLFLFVAKYTRKNIKVILLWFLNMNALMGCYFFFELQHDGHWTQIRYSMIHFFISQIFAIIICVYYPIANILTNLSLQVDTNKLQSLKFSLKQIKYIRRKSKQSASEVN